MSSCSPAIVSCNSHLNKAASYDSLKYSWKLIRVLCCLQLVWCVRKRTEIHSHWSFKQKTSAFSVHNLGPSYICSVTSFLWNKIALHGICCGSLEHTKLCALISVAVVLLRSVSIVFNKFVLRAYSEHHTIFRHWSKSLYRFIIFFYPYSSITCYCISHVYR